MPLKLAIIIASTRPGRAGPPVAKWVEEFSRTHGKFDVEVVDLAELNLPLLDEANHPARRMYEKEHTKRWSAIVGAADAFIIVTPEYDFFAPASLVNAIQFLVHEWAYKAAAVVCYGGVSGGLRASQVVRQLLGNLNVMAISQSVPVPFFTQHITDGVFQPNDKMTEGATLMLNELHKWATALQPMRAPAAT